MLHLVRPNLLLAAALAFAAPAQAETADGQFATRGIGAVQCKALPELLGPAENRTTRDQFVAWITGYLSHASRATPATFDVMPVQDNYGIEALAELLCRDNPELLVETVVFEIVRSLAAGAVTGPTDLVSLELDGARVDLRGETLRKVQDVLVAQGHLSADDADGAFGPRTAEALRAFQKAASIRETGLPDTLTLFIMFKPA